MKLDVRLTGMLDTAAVKAAGTVTAKPGNAAPPTSFSALLARLAAAAADQPADGTALPAGDPLPAATAGAAPVTELAPPLAQGAAPTDIPGADAAVLPEPLPGTAIAGVGPGTATETSVSAALQTEVPGTAPGSAADEQAALAGGAAALVLAGGSSAVPSLRPAHTGAAAASQPRTQPGGAAIEAAPADAPALSPQPAPVGGSANGFSLAAHELEHMEAGGRADSNATGAHDSAPSSVQIHHGSGRTPVSGGMLATLPSPLATPQWQQEFSQQIVHLVQRGEQRVALHLNPAELGPLVVDMEISEHGALLQFASGHAQVRSALEQALPQLRDALAEQGISLGETHIGSERHEQQAFAFRGNAPESDDARQGGSATPEPALAGVSAVLPADGRVNLYV